MDTSHLYLLLRMALVLDASDAKAALLDLIDAHSCHVSRHLVSSPYLVASEIIALPDASHARPLSEFLTAADLAARLVLHDDDGWSELPARCPEGGLNFGDGDRRWVACTEAASAVLDEDAYLATDDEDLILNMRHCVMEGLIATMPIPAVDMMLRLLDCGSLEVSDLEAMLEAEDARLRDDVAMQDRKRAVKTERLAGVAARLGLMTA